MTNNWQDEVPMDLDIENLTRTSRVVWTPFEPSPEFGFDWRDMSSLGDRCWVVRQRGVEVARVALTDRNDGSYGQLDQAYRCPKVVDPTEIFMIEVAVRHRREGIATAVVELVSRRHPGRRILAQSDNEESDLFWDSLGWDSYRHRDEDRHQLRCRVLFIQPE